MSYQEHKLWDREQYYGLSQPNSKVHTHTHTHTIKYTYKHGQPTFLLESATMM